jgi:hypothetical protein
MAVFGTFLGVRPSVALNANLNRSSSNFHKRLFVMCLNTCEGLVKRRQLEGYFFFDGPRPPEMAFLAVYFQLFLSAARRVLVIPCVQPHWAASLHLFWSSYAKEIRRKQHLPLLSTRGVPPSTQSKFSLWGWGVIYMWRAPNLAIPRMKTITKDCPYQC